MLSYRPIQVRLNFISELQTKKNSNKNSNFFLVVEFIAAIEERSFLKKNS